ncbi:imelysin family protein [Hyphomicrobium sp.]|uniref:imelysin family protein n=1 Tax=Hyphomicrobium sp. TaxID=82 RepID=UPI002D76546E|nr:imelysin family protein [Hyphomicrobium sp.]HET6388648.1 imelysin family protein [Hyphomicrobium sp.]
MMIRKATLAGLFTFALALQTAGIAVSEPLSHEGMVKAAIEQHIVPHFNALKAAAEPLPAAVANVCKTGSPEVNRALSDQLAKTVVAYAGVDFLRFGPMLEKGRREQLSFWPDPRGYVSRQMRLILTKQDEALAQPGAIGKQSAAVQGLTALEYLIRDEEAPLGPDASARYRCLLAEAIAGNIVRLTSELAEEWEKPGGWAEKMLKPGPENDTYKSADEAAVEVVKALIVGISLTADVQMKPQIDPKIRLKPPYDKSGLQKPYYTATVTSLRHLYNALQLESWLPANRRWMKDWANGTWRTLESSDGAGGRAAHAERDDAPTPREVFDRANALRNMVANRLAVTAKLTVGFNELDGD